MGRLRDDIKQKLISRLGTVNDVALAREFGISANTVFWYRRKLNIRAKKNWSNPPKLTNECLETILPVIGEVPDTQLAKDYGVTHQRIQQLRKKHNINKAPTRTWRLIRNEVYDLTVAELSKKYNLHIQSIRESIKRYNGGRYKKAKKGYRGMEWPPNVVEIFATMKNKDIVSLYKISPITVCRKRKELGIMSPYNKMTVAEYRANRELISTKLKERWAKMSDEERIAATKYLRSKRNYLTRSK